MAEFEYDLAHVKTTLNPGAIPTGTDLVFAFKADGSPAAYTLDELAAYVVGVSFPQWLTDASHGAHIKLDDSNSAGYTIPNGILPLETIVRDSGMYTATGTLTIPPNVTKVQIMAGVRCNGADATLKLIKNADTTKSFASARSTVGHLTIVSPELEVNAGDFFQLYVTGVNVVFTTPDTFFNIRTTEKLT